MGKLLPRSFERIRSGEQILIPTFTNNAAAIAAGMSIVHISTEIRVAYRDAVRDFMRDHPEAVAPYKFLQPGLEAVQKVVAEKLRFFNEK